MRRSSLYLGVTGALVLTLAFLVLHASARRQEDLPARRERAAMVRVLGLTDLCLFTEARYTRHPSQADLHTAFQDHPLSLEHFPSGSLFTPPPLLKERHAPLD
jgi:hypothetical protein